MKPVTMTTLLAVTMLVGGGQGAWAQGKGAAGAKSAKITKKTAVTPDAGAAALVATIGEDDPKVLAAGAPKASEFPSAAKVTLLDLADITVRPDGSARTITRQVVKVFNLRGREQESDVKIPYNSEFETVRIIRARTIKPDGTVAVVEPADIHDQDAVDEGYSDAKIKTFSMPGVSPDSIIDYEYETNQKASMMPGQFWTRWYFQGGTDPVVQSRLTITAPKSLILQTKLKNTTLAPVTKDSKDGKSVITTWESKNPAPLEPEYMMPSADEILPTLTVSSLPSWQKIADWYSDLAKDRMTADPAIKARVAELIKGKTTPEEKAKAIFYDVEDKTRYVALEIGIGGYQPRTASSVLRNQYGDCKDMATLLVSMLREAGITAYPVLLQAGLKDPVQQNLPSPGAFNHAICLAEINGKQYWLDATAQLCPFGDIPGGDRGVETFVVRDGKGEFITIPFGSPEDNQQQLKVALNLNPDGSASGKVTVGGTGDVNLGLRTQLTYMPENKLKPYIEEMAKNIGPNAKVTHYDISDYKNRDVPVSISYDVTFPSWAKKSGELLLFKAQPEQTGGTASSPFSEETRHLPVKQSGVAQGSSLLELTLPIGFKPLALPPNAEVKSKLGEFKREVSMKDQTLTIKTTGVNFRAELPPSQYNDVRAYYDSYLKAADESVIIKKN